MARNSRACNIGRAWLPHSVWMPRTYSKRCCNWIVDRLPPDVDVPREPLLVAGAGCAHDPEPRAARQTAMSRSACSDSSSRTALGPEDSSTHRLTTPSG